MLKFRLQSFLSIDDYFKKKSVLHTEGLNNNNNNKLLSLLIYEHFLNVERLKISYLRSNTVI